MSRCGARSRSSSTACARAPRPVSRARTAGARWRWRCASPGRPRMPAASDPVHAYLEETTRRGVWPGAACGARLKYSDPGYILLGEVLRRVSGKPLDVLVRERITGPSGTPALGFGPIRAEMDRVAPTENGNVYERAKAAEVAPEAAA